MLTSPEVQIQRRARARRDCAAMAPRMRSASVSQASWKLSIAGRNSGSDAGHCGTMAAPSAGPDVVDLLPVRRVARELAIVETPRILRAAHDGVFRGQRLREELAHLLLQRRDHAPVDAVAHRLEEAPLPAGGVDGATRVGPLGIGDVDDGKLLFMSLRPTCADAATSAAACTDRSPHSHRRQCCCSFKAC